MNNLVFQNISKIIERDSKATTYKYALLRGVIDIIQDNSPYISFIDGRVHFPTGLLIEKWMIYYYPILESSIYIPQINGSANLAFNTQMRKIINEYNNGRGGYSAFYNDIRNKGILDGLHSDFIDLAKKLSNTITTMPMKYIGRSVYNDFYSIFKFEKAASLRRINQIDIQFLIQKFGTFSIPNDYYEAFKFLGSFISGQDSIFFKWAEFSVNASKNKLSLYNVLNEVLKSPITQRDVDESRKIYTDILKRQGNVFCVWSGAKIASLKEANIDHVIPFSVWKNNDLWNLLPATPKINNKKLDKIPAPEFIEKRKNAIIDYWGIINTNQVERFQKEIAVALLGNNSISDWEKVGISQLQKSCNYLIETRGFDAWKI